MLLNFIRKIYEDIYIINELHSINVQEWQECEWNMRCDWKNMTLAIIFVAIYGSRCTQYNVSKKHLLKFKQVKRELNVKRRHQKAWLMVILPLT